MSRDKNKRRGDHTLRFLAMSRASTRIRVGFDPVAIGDRIRRARKLRGWRMKDLAKATGLSKGMIGCYECGCRTPRLETMVRIAVALQRKLDYLVRGLGVRP